MGMGWKSAAAAAVMVTMVSGCSSADEGSDSPGGAPAPEESSTAAAPFPEGQYEEQDVVNHMGLVERDGLVYLENGDLSCEVAVVMNTSEMVALYADAGDLVATDPGQRVGVKLVGADERACYDAATSALADFDMS